MDAREALVALNLVEGIGPVRVRQLLEFFGEPVAILNASKAQLLQVHGIGEETADATNLVWRGLQMGAVRSLRSSKEWQAEYRLLCPLTSPLLRLLA